MPTIRVELFEGRSVAQKRALAKALTDATVNTLGGSPSSVDVVFYDVARHDWATAGKLWSDDAGAPQQSQQQQSQQQQSQQQLSQQR